MAQLLYRTSKKGLIEKSHLYATYLLFFLFPFPNNFSPLAIGLWAGTWLIWRLRFPSNKSSINIDFKRGAYLFVAFVLIHFLSPLWAEDTALGFHQIESKLGLLILPLLFVFGSIPRHEFYKIPRIYFLGSLFSLVFFFAYLLAQYGFSEVFRNQLDVLGLDTLIKDFNHPAYWTLNLVISFFLYLLTLKDLSKKAMVLFVVYYIALGAFIVLSGSRAGLINYLLCSVITLYFLGKKHWGAFKSILVFSVLLLSFTLVIIETPKFNYISEDSELVSVRSPRKVLWKTAANMFVQRPILGYGLGSSKEQFVEQCQVSGIYNATHRRLNVHNQYLEFLLESGALSLMLFFLSLYFFYRGVAPNHKQNVLLIFLVLGISLTFESMLLRISGISSFVALLYYISSLGDQKQSHYYDSKNTPIFKILILAIVILMISLLGLQYYSAHRTFDPNSPITYASKVYTVVPAKELPSTVPTEWDDEVSACRFDATAKASLWSGNAYMLNKIESKKLKVGEILTFSTYCYVSTDFDGTWVRASIDRADGENFGSSLYDLEKKGTWQKLEVVVENQVGEMPAYHYFCKEGCNSFKDLKGYVLFAYPLYIISDK